MKKNQNGFSLVEGLLILIIVGLIGFVGWYVWHAKSNADKNLNAAANSYAPASKQTSKALEIKEWGVKLTFPGAEKVTYNSVSCGNPYCSAELIFKSSVTNDDKCNFVAELLQSSQQDSTTTKKIGNSYYGFIDNSRLDGLDFSTCSSSINTLRSDIIKSLTASSINRQ